VDADSRCVDIVCRAPRREKTDDSGGGGGGGENKKPCQPLSPAFKKQIHMGCSWKYISSPSGLCGQIECLTKGTGKGKGKGKGQKTTVQGGKGKGCPPITWDKEKCEFSKTTYHVGQDRCVDIVCTDDSEGDSEGPLRPGTGGGGEGNKKPCQPVSPAFKTRKTKDCVWGYDGDCAYMDCNKKVEGGEGQGCPPMTWTSDKCDISGTTYRVDDDMCVDIVCK